jgi:acid phosphatase
MHGGRKAGYRCIQYAAAGLPTVAFVVPNLQHDMHDGSIAEGDRWLKANLDGYVQWVASHNSLLVFTFDEDDGHEN